MKNRITWLAVSSAMVAALLLASCGPGTPTPEEETTPPKQEGTQPPVKEDKPALLPTVDKVKLTLKKTDGTTVEKLVEKPKYGGTLIQILTTEPLDFDELLGGNYLAPSLMLTNEELVAGDWAKGPAGTGEASWLYYIFPPPDIIRGTLAESWEISNPDTITYRIRKGVRWHNKPPVNGRELVASDIVFTLKRLSMTPGAYHYAAYPYIESLSAPDKYTVIVKCKPGKAGMAFEKYGDYTRIVPPEVVEKYGDLRKWENSCGTGAYMLTDYVPSSALSFKRNPDHWDKDPFFPENQLPYLDGVRWIIIKDLSTRLAALRTAKIDYLEGVMWEDAASLRKTNPELNYLRYLSGGGTALFMRVDTPGIPMYDKRVRRALCMAIDQKKIVDTYYGGNAEIAQWPVADVPEFKGLRIPLAELPQPARELFEYHPDKAKQLLAEAGYPNGFKAEILCVTADVDMLSVVKDYWSKIGVDLTLDVKEFAVYQSLLSKRGYKQMIYRGLTSTIPFNFMETRPESAYNLSMINDARINEAIKEIDANYFDEPKRRKLFRELIPYMLEQVYQLELPGQYLYNFWQPWVKGYSGEIRVGYQHASDWPKYIWLDQELKEKMTGRR